MSSHNSSTKSSFRDEGPSELIQKLSAAIQAGEEEKAAELVAELTARKLKLDIAVPKEDYEIRTKENEFSVKVHVEDRESKGCIINMMVKSCDTIADLKRKMMLKHDFPTEVQRWIIGKRIYNDKEKLSHCGVKGAGHTLYLYLVTARSVGLSRQQYEAHKQTAMQGGPVISPAYLQREPSCDQASWVGGYPLDGQVQYFDQTNQNFPMSSPVLHFTDPNQNQLWQGQPSQAMSSSQGSRHSVSGGSMKLQEMLQSSATSQPVPAPGQSFVLPDANQSPEISPVAPSGPGWPRFSRSPSPGPSSPAPSEPTPLEQIGWKCPRCTLINLPLRPGCEVCSGSRPLDYTVPENYQPTVEERTLLENDQQLERLTREAPLDDRGQNVAGQVTVPLMGHSASGLTPEQLQDTLMQSALMASFADGGRGSGHRGLDVVDLSGGQNTQQTVRAPPPPSTSPRAPVLTENTAGHPRGLVLTGAQGRPANVNIINLPHFEQLQLSYNDDSSLSDENN